MATNNEQVFRIWMQKQTQKNKDKGYTNNTIEAYCGALATKAKNLQLPDSIHIQPNLFLYNDFQEFQSICDIIRAAPNYKEIDKKAGNGAFSAGIQRYLEFLHDKNRASIQEDNKTMENNELKEYTELLRMKKNIILQGAPGTGKTYTTAALALSLIDENISYFNHDVVMEKYQEYVEKGQIAFVTFHQSMDYEDFVEGLKPQLVENSDGNTAGIAYRIEDGIFKRLCKKAIEDSALVSMQDNFESVWGKLVDELDEKDFIEIPLLSGKNTFRIELNEYGTGLATRTYEGDSFQKDRWISGKSKFFSKEQLYNVYRGLPGTPARGHDNYRKAIIRYCKENLGLIEYALPLNNTQSNTNPFILIIDEINRGNVSKIFGELITLLESDKRIGSMHPINVRLPYSKELFSVPPNIYLIGTMNTTDRSVGTIDYAVRRRFAFITLKSEKSAIEKFYDNVPSGTDAVLKNKALELFNTVKTFIKENKIEQDFDDLMPGHSYFMAESATELKQKFTYEVLPLLHEYHKDGLLKAAFDEAETNNRIDDDR
ncbi:AAA domain-containing protein [Treponema vincentii]|uniref:McrB family protein n=1 Tax=Treponema vincentii TaxID=69710 RepID=UPI003D8E5B9B